MPQYSRQPALAALVVLHVRVALVGRTRAAEAEIELTDILVTDQTFGRPVDDDLSGLEDVAVARDCEGHGRILLDEQHRDALLCADAGDDRKDLLDELRGKSE